MDTSGTGSFSQPRSDDEFVAAGPSTGKPQRSAKACDRCRRSKSKCQPAPEEGEPCKSCALIGAECTYTAPSFRRGPPKGYIQALEHRLHQVESVLAAVMTSPDPRTRSVIDELAKDELAAHILDTVDTGPFGRTGREKRAYDTTKDNFFTSIVAERPKPQSHRSRRESRATRENVIENVIARDPMIQTTRPTLLWQDRLSERLARSFGGAGSSTPHSAPSPIATATSSQGDEAVMSEPPRSRRRLYDTPPVLAALSASYSSLSRLSSSQQEEDEDLDDCADAFGNLSIDENREVRYHGNSCGLQFLVQTERTDKRNLQGIWNFPMANLWGADGRRLPDTRMEPDVPLPPFHVQDRLVDIFFAYVNPAVPIVDEDAFREQYQMMKYGYPEPERPSAPPTSADVRPEFPQKLSKLLLFAIYAYAATYLDALEAPTRTNAAMSGGARASDYAACARRILDTTYHQSRSSTVQALVLLGLREFGIASLEEGWLHTGMALRMALDLGLNRNPEKWMHNGRELFAPKEQEIRKRIWWGCCIADKFSALFLGRTVSIHEGEFSTPLPEIPLDDADRVWQPSLLDPRHGSVPPVPACHTGYLRHISSLYIILGDVLKKIYRVSRAYATPPRALREELNSRLLQWVLDLPEPMKYSPAASTRPCPAPHILAMHIQYWAGVLLLHRPFIPKGEDLARAGSPSLDPDPIPWESYDICQGAANQVASFAMLYHDKYDMRWAPPYLANCIQAAGITHVITLKYKPLEAQASVGLQKCIAALSGMEVSIPRPPRAPLPPPLAFKPHAPRQATWASALRVRHLIQNAKVNVDRAYPPSSAPAPSDRRQKRTAQVAFALDPPPYDAQPRPSTVPAPAPLVPYTTLPPPQIPPPLPAPPLPAPAPPHAIPAHVPVQPPELPYPPLSAGYYVPQQTPAAAAAPPLTGYMPGYDSWWSGLDGGGVPASAAGPPNGAHSALPGAGYGPTGAGGAGGAGRSVPQGEFTFGQQHFSPEFLQAMRDPMLHFPSVFAHMY
ncbi:fungal-specific transcription factor domain-containing protein [Trametes gibbosa]|uniref:Zn(2)-Cys(6)14 n=1 Tax=Trametes gibbosa TaxID=160864 RepID=A0A976SH68_9APHY|nr:fungal-specific transcription factor domain-containing protein [Trametes gibbosa]UVB64066.1 Zn(2)-Cys(6)14 [Trametes gibbosa]